LELQRKNEAGAKIDNFRYNYEDKTAGYLQNTNKLRGVDDLAGVIATTEVLEDQDEDNYQYNDIGNLNKDNQEEIENIEWTVYGKVKAETRKSYPVLKLPLSVKKLVQCCKIKVWFKRIL
jgi:hypothetical protein